MVGDSRERYRRAHHAKRDPTMNPTGFQRLSVCLVVCALLASSVPQARGQGVKYPSTGYQLSFQPYYEGDYATAARRFRGSSRSAMRTVKGKWVDSICHFTMMGECLYQMGETQKALDAFNEAVKISIFYSNWMLRIRYPKNIQPLVLKRSRRVTWGGSLRSAVYAKIPNEMLSRVSNRPNLLAAGKGGVLVGPPELYKLGVRDVAMALALAIRRRTELLGPVGEHDLLTHQLIEVLSRRAAPNNHWSQTWISVHLGLAYATAGKYPQAIAEMQRGMLLLRRYDHPLTSTVLMELGKLALQQENYQAAIKYSHEATICGAAFAQYHVMEEAFRTGMVAHLISGQNGIYPPLLDAARWANRQSRALQVGTLISAAENAAAISNTKLASTLIGQAASLMAKRNMGAGRMGGRYNYVAALISYQQGNVSQGQKSLNRFLKFQRRSSNRLFQSSLAAALYADNTLKSMRTAQDLFEVVLREPRPKDWAFEPMESLGRIAAPNIGAMEYWFEVNLQAKNVKKAMEITDRIRRLRFYSTLPMAGRLLAFRWILDAPPEALTSNSLMQRMDLLSRYPKYREIRRKANLVRGQIRQITRKAIDETSAKRLKVLFAQQGKLANARELILHELALRREPSEFVFPPQRKMEDIQKTIRDDQAIFTYFATGRYVYAFAFSKENLGYWRIPAPNRIRQSVKVMLREMGNFDRNTAVSADQMASDKWKKPAQELLEKLTQHPKAEWWNKFSELVIVPDGVLWYVPFAALQVTEKDGTLRPLISKVRVRFSPTIGLIPHDNRKHHRDTINAVIMGSLFPRADNDFQAAEQSRIRKALPDSLAFSQNLPLSSNSLSTVCDRMVVMADMDDGGRGVYSWSPMQLDKGRTGSHLANWFSLPWGRCEQMVLPGYHTSAESALKRGGKGNEIFLSICGLMSTGTRTILMSHWRTGGQANHDLVREFVQELPHTEPSIALQRSIHLVRRNELELEFEPRLRKMKDDVVLSADHPLFWANMMLVDVSGSPKRAKQPAPLPAKPLQKAGAKRAFPALPAVGAKGKGKKQAFPPLKGGQRKKRATKKRATKKRPTRNRTTKKKRSF